MATSVYDAYLETMARGHCSNRTIPTLMHSTQNGPVFDAGRDPTCERPAIPSRLYPSTRTANGTM